jgi:hypothetical protein
MRRVIVWAGIVIAVLLPTMGRGQHVDRLSATSLKLTIRRGEVDIGSATGFVVQKNQKYYLITNRHVVLLCGEDKKNQNNIGGWLCADNLQILHNRANHAGEWFLVREDLFDEHNARRWIEHPTLGGSVDLVALPLRHTEGVEFLPLDLDLRKTEVVIAPSDPVSIVGFPHGVSQDAGLAIWKTGMIASDMEVNLGGKPCFLLDTTAVAGMSGSPAYVRRNGAYMRVPGLVEAGSATKFIGVYSAQSPELEIGVVWKADVVFSLYESLP